MSKILKVQNLSKTYKSGDHDLNVLNNVSFEVDKGQSFAIVGPSGSGKTTLLGLCAGLDTTDQGEVWLCGSNLFDLDEDGRALLRNQNVGFVFQDFQLLPTLTALENVVVPLELRGAKKAKEQGKELLAKVGLQEREAHYPSQLSGGEQQRVALARAFANRPLILFADEPTGNLDDDTGTRIEDLLFELNKEQGTALVIVTHDLELAKKTDKSIRLRSGKIEETVG
ncbi:ABC transporter ATP-binding protein [Flagellimonas sp. MMG031]|uniref:ABC transporter ATP-binding protein n=1 Tax=Flagellimonas sp. MMG031 TaxID=3158549 RepID=A0AAU7MTK0_9FLAO|nr:ABC transporter ATP-binding protein [Allomuricauda sp.]MBO6828827.1 ABC transporter ATP-binding protein [Allomuricauda sp.]